MIIAGLGIVSCLLGLAITIIGLVAMSIFDLDWGDTLCKVGLMMMIIPFILFLLFGAFGLLLALFGLTLLL